MSSSRSGSRPAIFMRADTASEPSPLATTGLTRAYRGGKGVFDITLKLAAGEVMGLMGPNGSGKTTLLQMLATAATPSAGQISWFGKANPHDPSVRRRLGVMLDQPAHFDKMSGYQNAWFFAHQFGLADQLARDRLDELFRWSGLWDARDQLVGEYSLGMKRKLNLVEAAKVEGDTVHIILARGANPAQVLAVLNGTADLVSNMRVRRPNLGDVFLKLTGVALPAVHR